MERCFALLLISILWSCSTSSSKQTLRSDLKELPSVSTSISRIAFGSCNRETLPQPMWPVISSNQPDLWIWLGDNIYGDTEDMSVMREKYLQQKKHPAYREFIRQFPVIGIWDDHDYGVNDGDKNYAQKSASKDLMLDFLDVPKKAAVRQREGAYQQYTYGTGAQKIKVLLLDSRYFRDPLQADTVTGQRYLANPEGDLLGEAQWQWLEAELRNSDAALHLIANGIQMIPEEHAFEKWANFPRARKRLFDLLEAIKPAGTILLSGDRHIGEISRIELDGLDYPLYEITSSGLTHSYEAASGEANRHRVGELTGQKNFGLITITWTRKGPVVNAEIKGLDNQAFAQAGIQFH
ncbi:MAG: alkaline phosphatase D family protein [Bacteroidota bacterium]